jgi:DNA invertase Pin-like site-specific DNA recombinase
MENIHMRAVIYLRVSTASQTVENQLRELRLAADRLGYTIVKELRDEGISGAKGKADRPALAELHRMISRKEIDCVMTTSIDRLGRSIRDLQDLLADIEAMGINLYIHNNGINTATIAGKLVFNIFASLASWERDLIRERTLSGIARAKADGKKFGRPSRVNEGTASAVKMLRDQGMGICKIAKTLRIGVSTTSKILKAA